GTHRRMPGRKADRARILADLVEAQRPRVADQHAEDAAARRQVADLPPRLRVDAGGDEALEARAAGIEYAESGISGTRQRGRGLDHLLEHRVERELRAERDARLDEGTRPVGPVLGGCHHAEAIALGPRLRGARGA